MKEYTTPEQIVESIALSRTFTERALVALYHRQTDSEKAGAHTAELNGRGFSAFDAGILTSFAEQVLGTGSYEYAGRIYARHAPKNLSDKQLVIARKKLPRYAKQLLAIARERSAGASGGPAVTVVNPKDVRPTADPKVVAAAILTDNPGLDVVDYVGRVGTTASALAGEGWPVVSRWQSEVAAALAATLTTQAPGPGDVPADWWADGGAAVKAKLADPTTWGFRP